MAKNCDGWSKTRRDIMRTHSYKQITSNPKQHTVTVYTNKAQFSSVLTKIHSSKQITLNVKQHTNVKTYDQVTRFDNFLNKD